MNPLNTEIKIWKNDDNFGSNRFAVYVTEMPELRLILAYSDGGAINCHELYDVTLIVIH